MIEDEEELRHVRLDLVTRLITGLIDDKRSLELDNIALPRRVNWRAKVDINDAGKLIGKKAAHLYSLRVLLSLMGGRNQEDWRLEVTDPDDGERSDKRPVDPVKTFDPHPTLRFIEEILDAILYEPPLVECRKLDNACQYNFVVSAMTRSDHERLLTKVPAGRIELTPVAALGTLFRAYGRQQGVGFTVEVPSK